MTTMLLGPVFRAELLRTSRRRPYYFLRVVYGIVLLLIVWLNYQGLLVMAEARGGEPLIADFAYFALNTFTSFAVVQLGTILVLIPALFGGVIADEKQRKTMHYLMASRLSSAEIVLDKLAARMLQVGVFILLGLPVMSLLTLFGGVPWDYVVGAYAATFSITFFAATLAVLISTFGRRVGGAVLIAYLVEIGWLVIPPVVDAVCRWVFPRVYFWIGPLSEWVGTTTPVSLLIWTQPFYRRRFLGTTAGIPPTFFDQLAWMIGLQCGLAVFFLLIASWQLRPTFRRQEESRRWVTWLPVKLRRPRWLSRPECGSDAMLWKELHFARTDLFTKLVVLPATVLLTVFVLLQGDVDEKVVQSFASVWQRGYTAVSPEPISLNHWLTAVSPMYIGLWLLAVAGASASGVTVEREQETWDSLISTQLTGWEIVRGKAIGAIWGLRGFGGLFSLFWLVGLAAGAVHPLGLLLALLVVSVLTWFVTALGTYVSLTARTTSRALTGTLVILFFINVGYLVVLYPVLLVFSDPSEWHYSFTGCTPITASQCLLDYRRAGDVALAVQGSDLRSGFDLRGVLYATMVLAAYAIAALLLTGRLVRRFDEVVDRPRAVPDRGPTRPLCKINAGTGIPWS